MTTTNDPQATLFIRETDKLSVTLLNTCQNVLRNNYVTTQYARNCQEASLIQTLLDMGKRKMTDKQGKDIAALVYAAYQMGRLDGSK